MGNTLSGVAAQIGLALAEAALEVVTTGSGSATVPNLTIPLKVGAKTLTITIPSDTITVKES